MSNVKASALKILSLKIDDLSRRLEPNPSSETIQKRLNEYKMALIRCRDMIENLYRAVPDRQFELKNEAAIFLNALSLTLGDGFTMPFKRVDEHNKELVKSQIEVADQAKARAKEVAKETNAKRRAAAKKSKGRKKK